MHPKFQINKQTNKQAGSSLCVDSAEHILSAGVQFYEGGRHAPSVVAGNTFAVDMADDHGVQPRLGNVEAQPCLQTPEGAEAPLSCSRAGRQAEYLTQQANGSRHYPLRSLFLTYYCLDGASARLCGF